MDSRGLVRGFGGGVGGGGLGIGWWGGVRWGGVEWGGIPDMRFGSVWRIRKDGLCAVPPKHLYRQHLMRKCKSY